MKIVRFAHPQSSESRIGILLDDGVLDFSAAYRVHRLALDGARALLPVAPQARVPGLHCDPIELLREGLFTPDVFQATADFVAEHDMQAMFTVAQPRVLAPIARPPKIMALGRNYRAHAVESGLGIPDEPIFFCKASTAVIGPGDAVVIKPGLTRVDPEVELAVIIGARGADIPLDRAPSFVAGYTVLNDVTARDMQKDDLSKANPWFRSKGIDTFCPLGPCIVLPDEITEPVELDLEMRVNGEVRQRDNTASLMFKIPQLIEFISRHMTLEPGDIISTGTPEGMAPVEPGDVMEAEVKGIGILRNPVVGG
jgi:2-keto-4-pentenoate hydratase/2-oxohepta-3-ene-1,7-dioic acid hydratase in catechol pathway